MNPFLAGNVHEMAETLVRTIARAFYPDEYVVVFDVLTKEKYITKEEIAPRLGMSNNDVKAILAVLCDKEGLIRKQELSKDGAGGVECYYIDYQSFTNLVRYRIYLMQEELKNQEKNQQHDMRFRCPTCSTIYESLRVQKLRTLDNKYACPSCCNAEDFGSVISEDYFRLIECDRDSSLISSDSNQGKLMDQLKGKDGYRKGIFELLRALKDVPLLRNLPSENMEHGLRTSAIDDEKVMMRIDKNMADRGTQRINVTKKRAVEEAFSSNRTKIVVQFTEGDEDHSNSASGSQGMRSKVLRNDASMPSFLVDSRVLGGKEALEQARLLGQTRELGNGADDKKVDSKDDALKSSGNVEPIGNDCATDVDWED